MRWALVALLLVLLTVSIGRALWDRVRRQEAGVRQHAALQSAVTVDLAAGDVVQATSIDLAQIVFASGPVEAQRTALIKARIPGEVVTLRLREGDPVRTGQVVAEIDAMEARLRHQQALETVRAAQAQVDIALRTDRNNQALRASGFLSPTAFDHARSALDAAQANLAQAKAAAGVAAKSLADATLRSPITGYVAHKYVEQGERVGVEARLLDIVDITSMEWQVSLSPAEAAPVRVGQSATLRVDGIPTALHARVARISPATSARAVPVTLVLEAGYPPLRHGLFARGSVQTGSVRTLAVPLSAVRTDKASPYVQRIVEGKVQHQTVRTGARGDYDGQTWVAIEGLAQGASLVDGTVGTLRPGTSVRIRP
ncbi:efflux RND transporter periplasmic adaptor subunit [Candidatus Symbiobacter mobilis]|uniref:efflux RND transporter periplasmic adaptor subunit n=1 Tax=Candidatus Symbiobacter mobilis TaxID=1436290 RepID=UPI001650DC2D|nr:efflux RND transporter periplasmic adaptor subunit [Candidatus Symbiobacter mobilis]